MPTHPRTLQSFVDEVKIQVASGAGGAGSVSFRREKYVPKGGPDGGDGGRGGDVIVRGRSDLRTLIHLTRSRQLRGERGQPGSGRNRHGRDGRDAVVEVPPGTAVYDDDTGELLVDIVEDGQEMVLLKGGRGGKGNAHFATARHQAPRFAQDGEPGEERALRVELRLIADVGFVGKPNAGKSSLLGRMTAAHPEIGAYPFTTKIPNLGVMYLDHRQLILADIPGLIEGASHGAGLGFRFLKHIARTRTLAYVVGLDDEDPVETVRMLEVELAEYGADLERKPRLIVGNKTDLPESEERLALLQAAFPDEPVGGVSAVTGDGVRQLAGAFFTLGGDA
ncbi:MAG: GTPase ObgE [Spirochaetota bacterium]